MNRLLAHIVAESVASALHVFDPPPRELDNEGPSPRIISSLVTVSCLTPCCRCCCACAASRCACMSRRPVAERDASPSVVLLLSAPRHVVRRIDSQFELVVFVRALLRVRQADVGFDRSPTGRRADVSQCVLRRRGLALAGLPLNVTAAHAATVGRTARPRVGHRHHPRFVRGRHSRRDGARDQRGHWRGG